MNVTNLPLNLGAFPTIFQGKIDIINPGIRKNIHKSGPEEANTYISNNS